MYAFNIAVCRQVTAFMAFSVAGVIIGAAPAAGATAATTSVVVTVPGTANLFGAGHSVAPAPGGGDGGSLPPSVPVTAGQTLSFGANGAVGCSPGSAQYGPDGSSGGGTVSIQSYAGISGADQPGGTDCGLALDGVFTNGTEPADPAPARLSFVVGDGINFSKLSPVLNQTFFIGDGVTGDGATQAFAVPTGATTLWLGVEDGASYTSLPGSYGDNSGSYNVTVDRDQSSTKFTTSSYTVVRYFQQISPIACQANLFEAGIAAASVMCAFLDNSANPYPSSYLAGSSLTRFIASRQYRGYIHMPAYSVSCIGGSISSISPVPGNIPFSWSGGYTRVQTGVGHDILAPSELYGEGSEFNSDAPRITFTSNGSSAQVDFGEASRIAWSERVGNYALTLLDAPFIWAQVDEQISCDGTFGLEVATDVVPSTDIYINGHEQTHDKQSSDLARFLEEGGDVLNRRGIGNLAYPCHLKHFNMAGKNDSSSTSCQSRF
jgi:hypothetical protein